MSNRVSWLNNPQYDEALINLRNKGLTYEQIAQMLSEKFDDNFGYWSVSERLRTLRNNNVNVFVRRSSKHDVTDFDGDISYETTTEFKSTPRYSENIIDMEARAREALGLNRTPRTNVNVEDDLAGTIFAPERPVTTTRETTSVDIFPEEAYEVDEEISDVWRIKNELENIYDLFNDGKSKKILTLSDLHAPFIDFFKVQDAILANKDADVIVLNGDVLNGDAMSSFAKIRDTNLDKEIRQVEILLDTLTRVFPNKKIVWNSGNHERKRLWTMISKTNWEPRLKQFALQKMDLLTDIAAQYKNVIVGPHFWVQIGKAVFVHPNGYSSALMSTALKQNEILKANRQDLLPNPEFEALIQGHTHDMGMYMIDDHLVIETGCLCHRNLEYKFNNPSKRRWVHGYAVVYLDGTGSVDFNRTRPIVLK